jgi:imidazole glycerol-phosphate synthase subunit HisF
MQLPRVIPCLLIQSGGLVKTKQFDEPTYIGDPINAVRIFNEMEADELLILDIDASRHGSDIRWRLIEEVAKEAFMPICYGGGISTVSQAEKLFRLGVEKVSLCSSVFDKPGLVKEIAEAFGSQSVVVTLEVKRINNTYQLMKQGGSMAVGKSVLEGAAEVIEAGAGELMINDVDRDGTMQGYDIELIGSVNDCVNVPVIACGGCGSLDDMTTAWKTTGISAFAAGSLFVYWGRLHGILINYPKRDKLKQVFK